MNGLLGYPSAAPVRLARLGAFGAMGAATEAQKQSLWRVLTGETYNALKAAFDENKAEFSQLDAIKDKIDQMPSGADKDAATAAYRKGVDSATKEYAMLVPAREAYMQVVNDLQTYSFGIAKPPTQFSGMGGMGSLGVIPVAVYYTAVFAAAVVALAYLVDKIDTGIAAAHGQQIETKGWIGQAADLAGSLSPIIHETAGLVGSLTWAAVLGVGLFAAYKFIQHRKGGGSTSVVAGGAGI